MIYEWKPGSGHRDVSAQAAGATIERLGGTKVCPPQRLVDEARPAASEIHSLFEWDDAVAAETYRTDQARRVIHSIVVVNEESPDAPRTPAFVSVRVRDEDGNVERGYVPVVRVLSDWELRGQAIDDIKAMVRGLQQRLASFEEFAPIVEAIDSVLGDLEAKSA